MDKTGSKKRRTGGEGEEEEKEGTVPPPEKEEYGGASPSQVTASSPSTLEPCLELFFSPSGFWKMSGYTWEMAPLGPCVHDYYTN